ncbi:uncharacterized protein LOC133452221 [Cololabis saira]|uniref:uncharacterized protein LOC133452221 n=1 Tax=Cololabis saira TaxID=129043 RepID=UPI002AD45A4C|nr:uncharacterized protein LOC133452221 [Cololabis saira]
MRIKDFQECDGKKDAAKKPAVSLQPPVQLAEATGGDVPVAWRGKRPGNDQPLPRVQQAIHHGPELLLQDLRLPISQVVDSGLQDQRGGRAVLITQAQGGGLHIFHPGSGVAEGPAALHPHMADHRGPDDQDRWSALLRGPGDRHGWGALLRGPPGAAPLAGGDPGLVTPARGCSWPRRRGRARLGLQIPVPGLARATTRWMDRSLRRAETRSHRREILHAEDVEPGPQWEIRWRGRGRWTSGASGHHGPGFLRPERRRAHRLRSRRSFLPDGVLPLRGTETGGGGCRGFRLGSLLEPAEPSGCCCWRSGGGRSGPWQGGIFHGRHAPITGTG